MYIRTRLALSLMLILLVVLGSFSWVIYQLTRSNLLAQIDWDVRQRASALITTAYNSPNPRPGEANLDVFATPDTYLQLYDAKGTVIASSGNLGDRMLPLNQTAIAGDQVIEQQVGTLPVFIYGKAYTSNNQVVGYVVVARSPRTIYLALNRLQGFLFPGVGIAWLFAGLVVWLLVRRAMRPLERLAADAAKITAVRDHTRRLKVEQPANEINRLAQTINGTLGALEEAYRQVQAVNDAQMQFLADVSHELRTPLTIMLSSLDLVSKVGATDPEFQAKALADMRIEADRMARMVTQLLMLARADAGAALVQEPILLVDIVADVCRQAEAAGNGVNLKSQGLEQLEEAVVWGSPDYLKQLFLILVDNAAKYTPSGKTVTVEGSIKGNAAEVTITDTGIGISPADLPRLFERFFRAQNARFRSGMGLGLSIAQRITEQHSGTITVLSELGQGSSFTVTLPLLDSESLQSKTHPDVPQPPADLPRTRRRLLTVGSTGSAKANT